ncbi:NUDIX hydrolase [archaeon]|nr:NUDIX hydrolase [archaeon]
MIKPWKVMSGEDAFKTKWFTIRKYSVEKPDGKMIPDYYVHEARDSVMIACITDEGKLVVERQYRVPLRRSSMDFPAGSVEPGDKNLEKAALRELAEETGFVADKAELLFTLDKDPGFSASKMHVFLVRGARRRTRKQDENEQVAVSLVNPKQLLAAAASGELSCSLCVATTYRLAHEFGWK